MISASPIRLFGPLVCCLVATAVAYGDEDKARNAAAAAVPLIPREVLFGNPDKASPQTSPDGKLIGYLAPVEGVLNVWVGPVDDPAKAKPVTKDANRGIRSFFWAYNNSHVLYIQDTGGDENWHLYSVDLTNDKILDLTPMDNIQARVQEGSQHHPDEFLIAINNRNPQLHDIHKVNIKTGEMTLVEQNDRNFAGYVTDDHFNVLFATVYTPDGGSEVFRKIDEGKWDSFAKIPMEDNLTTGPVGVDKDSKHLYMIDSRGRNTAALTTVEIATGESKVLAQDERADISGAMVHPTEHHVQAVSFNYDRVKWQILDESIKPDFEFLRTVADGDFNVTSRTLDDKHWTVAYVLDDGPVRYYTYDREAKKAKFLFTNRADMESVKLAKMHPVIIKSRDGLNLVSYLTLPVWTDSDNDGRPEKPLPMVLLVHGGPWARDSWGLNSMHQWLANRGYAVLSVNYRGSTGFGKQFINAADKEWAGKMHDDLLDAVKWAVAEKIADEKQVAIMGGSYGGYATLVGLTFTPETFACGVDIVGPSNLVTLLETIPPYWAPILDMFTTRVGDHRTEDGKKLLTERSPLTHVDKIKRPLLIGQGANDPRVKQSESDQIVKAMQEKNIPVTYVLYPDEGHGFARPPNRMSFFAVSEAFLSQHLGGRFEPIGDDFENSTITVPEGAENIPGLPEKQKTG